MPKSRQMVSSFLGEFYPSKLLPSITAGILTGVMSVIVSISMAALIFSGKLSGHVSNGIGVVVFSGIVIRIVVALMSHSPGTIATPLVEQMTILAVIAASIQNTGSIATVEEMFLTVIGAIVLTSLLTGVFLLALGWLKAGAVIRHIPYPVIAGFLAGTGWLLVQGSIQVMTDVQVSISKFPWLFQPGIFFRWLSGLIFAILLLAISRRYTHVSIIPISFLAGFGVFYLLLFLTKTSMVEASANGWLLGPFSKGGLWQPLSLAALSQVNWRVILNQVGSVITVMVISAISLLLNARGLELVVEKDIDVNRELRAVGIANLVSGLCGGMVGSHTLPDSTLAYKMGAKSRLVGVFGAALYAAILILDSSFLSIFPRPLLGGLIMFLGVSLLAEWVYNAWFRLSRVGFFLVLLILFFIGALGFLQGCGGWPGCCCHIICNCAS